MGRMRRRQQLAVLQTRRRIIKERSESQTKRRADLLIRRKVAATEATHIKDRDQIDLGKEHLNLKNLEGLGGAHRKPERRSGPCGASSAF